RRTPRPAGAQHRRRLDVVGVAPVLELRPAAAARVEAPHVGALALAVPAVELLLGVEGLVVPVLLLLDDAEVDERAIPDVADTHDGEKAYRPYRIDPMRTNVAPSSAATR